MNNFKKLNSIRFKLGYLYLKRNNLARAIELAWEILDDDPNNRKGIKILKTARKRECKLSVKAV
jgi:hypothetical protein